MAKPSPKPQTAIPRVGGTTGTGAREPAAVPGGALRAYRVIARAAAPVAPLLLRLRAGRGKEDPARAPERLGRTSRPRPKGPLLWLHAASVGETNAILPLIGALGERATGLSLLLTTGTVTSAKLAQSRLPKEAIHQFAPLDIPQFIAAFLDHWRPDAAIFAESEIWPNLILELAGRGIPLALVNGRLSERSYRRWLRRPGLSAPLFSRFQLVLAQNGETAQRFAALGARPVQAVGNLKMDGPAPPADPDMLARLRKLTGARPIVAAASTHPGEDEAVIAAHKTLAPANEGLLTIIAPRHPERGAAVAALARRAGLAARLRSAGKEPDADCEIYVADTIGELGLIYALSPIAFVGGSLIPHGGQNPVEAVRHGCAVVTGPHTENFADAYRSLANARACVVIEDGHRLAPALSSLLEDAPARKALAGRASAAVAAMEGALERTLAALAPLLPVSLAASGKSDKSEAVRAGRGTGNGIARAP